MDTIIGLIAGLLTTFAFLPQIIKTIKTKDVEAISLIMYFCYTIGVIGWLYYGFVINNIVLLVTNSFSFIFGLVMISLKLKYKNNKLNHFALFAESRKLDNVEMEALNQAFEQSIKKKPTLPNRL